MSVVGMSLGPHARGRNATVGTSSSPLAPERDFLHPTFVRDMSQAGPGLEHVTDKNGLQEKPLGNHWGTAGPYRDNPTTDMWS